MNKAPLILILTPVLLPIVTGPIIGMSEIRFGIMLLMNLELGLTTPPVGTALFVVERPDLALIRPESMFEPLNLV